MLRRLRVCRWVSHSKYQVRSLLKSRAGRSWRPRYVAFLPSGHAFPDLLSWDRFTSSPRRILFMSCEVLSGAAGLPISPSTFQVSLVQKGFWCRHHWVGHTALDWYELLRTPRETFHFFFLLQNFPSFLILWKCERSLLCERSPNHLGLMPS